MEKFDKKDRQLVKFLRDFKKDPALLPGVEFMHRGKTELLNIFAIDEKVKNRFAFFYSRTVRMISFAVLLIFLLSGGLVLAAGQSSPTSSLYPVKIASENVALWLTSGETERQIRTQQLENRLEELEELSPTQAEQQETVLQLFLEQYGDLVGLHPQQGAALIKLLERLDNLSPKMSPAAQQLMEKHPLLKPKKELPAAPQRKNNSSSDRNDDNTSSLTPTPKKGQRLPVKGKKIENVTPSPN